MTAQEQPIQAEIDTPNIESGLVQLQEAFRQETPPPPPAASSNLEDDPELIGDFVLEAREHLASAESSLLAVEKDPTLVDAVNSVFRSFHTIKGLAGFLSLGPVQAVAHETETILHHAREKRIAINPQLIDLTLRAADYIRGALDALSSKPPREAMESLPSNEALLRRRLPGLRPPTFFHPATEETAE